MRPNQDSCVLLFVDAPNVCRVYGRHVLGRKPEPNDWPRWNRVLANLEIRYGPVDAHYVVDGNGVLDRLWPFLRQLRQFGYTVDAPKGYPLGGDGDPVDDLIRRGIDKMASAVCGESTRAIVAAHDHGYSTHLSRLLDQGGTVTTVGFREWLAPDLLRLEAHGAEFLDIEHDLGGFDSRLDRPYRPDLPLVG